MLKKLVIMIVLLMFSFIQSSEGKEKPKKSNSAVIDLVASTRIIRQLICDKDFLKDCDQEQLDLLLDNMSPVQIATEVEIMRSFVPVVAYFFEPSLLHDEFLPLLTQIAERYQETVKFVAIDVTKLVQLRDVFDIEVTPLFVIFQNDREIARISGVTNSALIECFIEKNIENISNSDILSLYESNGND